MKNITVLCTAAAVLAAIASAMAENEKPVIINQPTSVKAKVGDSVTFTVGAVDVNTKTEKSFTTSIMGTVDLDMIYCPPGTFMMGSPVQELGRSDNETLHQVTLTKGFWIGKYEVTQEQFQTIMGNNPMSAYGANKGDNKPVGYISRESAMTFCDHLTQMERGTGSIPMNYKYTLPTEAQWEYACRAGTTTALNSGKNLLIAWDGVDANLDEVAWYKRNSGVNGGNVPFVQEVGQKLPNAWGIYDMHGNVAEMCLDGYKTGTLDDYGTDAVTDPVSSNGNYWVLRGGACSNTGDMHRSASRYVFTQDSKHGFRVVLVPVE